MLFQQFTFQQVASNLKIVKVQALVFDFRRSIFLRWSNEISIFVCFSHDFHVAYVAQFANTSTFNLSSQNSKIIKFH